MVETSYFQAGTDQSEFG